MEALAGEYFCSGPFRPKFVTSFSSITISIALKPQKHMKFFLAYISDVVAKNIGRQWCC
jgi:hypothetical protein